MWRSVVLLTVVLPAVALAQTTPPTPEQLRTLQLRLNEQQQQLDQLRLQQPPAAPRDQQLQSLQNRLDQQQLEIQRLQQQQQICVGPRC